MFKFQGYSFDHHYMIFRKIGFFADFFVMDDFGNAISVPFLHDWE